LNKRPRIAIAGTAASSTDVFAGAVSAKAKSKAKVANLATLPLREESVQADIREFLQPGTKEKGVDSKLNGPSTVSRSDAAKRKRVASPQHAGAREAGKQAAAAEAAPAPPPPPPPPPPKKPSGNARDRAESPETEPETDVEEATFVKPDRAGAPVPGPVEGDTVQVLSKSAKGWCKGEVQGILGDHFLVTFVEPQGKMKTKLASLKHLKWKPRLEDGVADEYFNAAEIARMQAADQKLEDCYAGVHEASEELYRKMALTAATSDEKAELEREIRELEARKAELERATDESARSQLALVQSPKAKKNPVSSSQTKLAGATPEKTTPKKDPPSAESAEPTEKLPPEMDQQQQLVVCEPRWTAAKQLTPRAQRAAVRAAKRDSNIS